ncbi:hypothetical protein LCGC14_2538910, partial [marine sediment metagenome]
RGTSLLPAGVTAVAGKFERGDSIAMFDPAGHAVGHGLSRYSAEEINQIKGRKSTEIEAILGYPGRAALVHRDDMAL